MASAGFSFFSKSTSKTSSSNSGTNVKVTTRVVQRPAAATSSGSGVKVVVRQATLQVSAPSRVSSTTQDAAKKRKEAVNHDICLPPAKKSRLSPTPSGSRAPSLAPSLQASIPSSRHSSLAPAAEGELSRAGSAIPDVEVRGPRECWTEEDGRTRNLLSCEQVIREMVKTYKAYFRNPNDPSDTSFNPDNFPCAELEYPNDHACERFMLLVPKDKDLYDPIRCLQHTIHTIAEHYLTPEQQALFGPLPDVALRNLSDDVERDQSPALDSTSRSASTPVASPPTTASSPSSSSESSLSSSASVSTTATSILSLDSCASLVSLKDFVPPATDESPSFGFPRRLQRAIATRDGPHFLKIMDGINALFRAWKYPFLSDDPFEPPSPNTLREMVKTWTESGIPDAVRLRIVDETYQRTVAPHANTLNKYQSFSSEVYGELLPPFVSEIIRATGLNSDSFLVDLGSGVGNVVMQASLETGCDGYGIEINSTPAKIARSQLEQFKLRCRMWGLKMGEVELEEGDMLESPRVGQMLAKADVVLVNNKVFKQDLNEAIKAKFLDLKEGAIVVSLKPFVQSSRLSERNIDDISSILRVDERHYRRGYVSWGDGGGAYYVHRVDRVGYASARKNHEKSRSSSVRSTRSRK